ncbi:hypothetical protein [Idiomarina sp.]|uniref:hypothetical protein n=1 Tax=Idiomarina sp. TaxID=1874361 RepID=UPI0025B84C31|nr:hypothetical protein [Idiomarina sp.]
MSMSRKLVESLVEKEIKNSPEAYQDLDIEKLTELANQAFLIQATQTDDKSVRKSLQEKIEHYNSIMSVS